MKSWKKAQKKYNFVAPCSGCGMPVTNEQIAVKEADIFAMDFDKREMINLPICFCSECLKRTQANNALTLKKAVKRYEQSMRNE